MTRRQALAALALPAALAAQAQKNNPAAAAAKRKTVKIADFDDSGKRTGVAEVERVEKSEAEWKRL